MNLQTPQGPLDAALLPEGDEQFIGVDERHQPGDLPAGMVSYAKGFRFRDGRAKARYGAPILRCGKTDGQTPFTSVLGVARFSDPTDRNEWLIIAAEGGVWRTAPNNVALPVPLPAGVTLDSTSFTMLVQCMDVILLLRGLNYPPLVCVDLDAGFKVVDPVTHGDGSQPIPNATYGLYFQNRLFLVTANDEVAVSLALDYTRYQAAIDAFRISQGDNEDLVAMQPLGLGTLVMFKSSTTLIVTGIVGDLSGATLDTITKQYGCAAPFSVVPWGPDLYWWSEQGVVSVQQTALNQLQGRTERLTDPMARTLARINPQYVNRIQGAMDPVTGNMVWAVPLDEARLYGPNVVPANATYSLDSEGALHSYQLTGLTAGQQYSWTQSGQTDHITNGSELLYGSVLFTAQGTSINIWPNRSQVGTFPVLDTVQLLQAEGVLNGVLVYDTANKAWAGCDEGPALLVKQWVNVTVQGRQRLAFLTPDGWVRLWEEGFEDELLQAVPVPYVDVLVLIAGIPATIQVNSGTAVTYNIMASFNSSTVWAGGGISGDFFTRSYLNLSSGYIGAQWSAPNTTPYRIEGGVRFVATNGVLPSVVTTGTAPFLDAHSGNEIQSVPVPQELITRGYKMQTLDRKRYLELVGSLNTWRPNFTLSVIVDGVAAETTYAPGVTRSNTSYDVHGKPDWSPNNVNLDHGQRGRQDYSVSCDLSDATGNLTQLGVLVGGGVGLNVDQHQEMTQRVSVSEQGSRMQLHFVNTSGRLEIQSVLAGAIEGEQESGLRAS